MPTRPHSETDVDLLLVEDNHDDARFVERLVQKHQHSFDGEDRTRAIEISEFTHVDRLADGLERIRTDPPDVILLDLMLPDSRGLETIERVVEHAPGVAIVVLTGRDEAGIGVDAIQRGAQDYLVKGTVTSELLFRTTRYALERTRNRHTLLEANHRLALLNRIVRQDIRNDVSMIVGWGDQLRTRIDSDDEPALEAILQAANHAVELTDTAAEVMDALSIEDVSLEPCDLYSILEAEVTRLRRERDVNVTITGNTQDPVIVYASPMLASVFAHLLTNAVDHSDRATPTVTVTVDLTADEVSVVIADDGVGIPDAQKEALADPNAHFDDRSGIGVGLYLVLTLLETFGGTLELEDNYPRGTSVTVTLERVPLDGE